MKDLRRKGYKKKVKNHKLENVVFKGFVTKDEYACLAKEVDVGLVSLSAKNKTPVMPGKILGFMAASIPIVAFLHKDSDGHDLIKQAKCGYSLVPDNLDEATKLIRMVYEEKNKIKKLGKNGYKYAEKNFSKEKCIDKIKQLIE